MDQAAVAVENTKTWRQRVSDGPHRLIDGPQRAEVSPDWRGHRAAELGCGDRADVKGGHVGESHRGVGVQRERANIL